MSNLFFQAFSEVIAFFENVEEKYGYNYILVGVILTPLYAESRQTQDIDIVIKIQVSEENKEILKKALNTYHFQPVISWEDTFRDWKSLKFIQFLDKTGSIKIDAVIMDPLRKNRSVSEIVQKLSLDNRNRITIQGIACWATSKEDFILSKLVYGRYQDYKDALACWIRYNTELDKHYLEENARNLRVEQEFQYILQKLSPSAVFSDD